ncbi:MAG: hypothetical protein ACP5FL_08095 [Thermoplasmatota archaeon]
MHISTVNSIHDGDLIKCQCGTVIGRDTGRKIDLNRRISPRAGQHCDNVLNAADKKSILLLMNNNCGRQPSTAMRCMPPTRRSPW